MEALSVTAYAVPALPKGELFASDGKGFLLMRSDILLHQLIKLPLGEAAERSEAERVCLALDRCQAVLLAAVDAMFSFKSYDLGGTAADINSYSYGHIFVLLIMKC